MVVNNKATEIGDELLIYGVIPIYGVVQLNSFVDEIVGTTINRFFEKSFQYSKDGLFFSEWMILNDSNVSKIEISPSETLFVNYIYKRSGSDTTGELEFIKVELLGDFVEYLIEPSELYKNSIFKDISLTNVNLISKSTSLLKKVLDRGILPEYIIRNRTENPQIDDKQFLEFWRGTSLFFSLFWQLSEKIKNFSNEEKSLREYLRQFNLLLCDETTAYSTLIDFRDNYIEKHLKRGTITVFESNGEFLYYIGKQDNDEFLFELITDENIGWNLGNSSPCYKGNNFSNQLIKSKEKSVNFENLENYSIVGEDHISIVEENDIDILKIEINPSDWYLPSSLELQKIYENLYTEGVGNYDYPTYLSSTLRESDQTVVFCTFFKGGNLGWTFKHNEQSFIVVRDFTSSEVFNLRDTGTGGGLIFYIEDLGGGLFKYYEAGPQQEVSDWGADGEIVESYDPSIGSGKTNTQTIVDALVLLGENDKPAQVCQDYQKISEDYIGIKMDESDFDKLIIIDSNIDYEITFWVKQEIISENINFTCKSFDALNDEISLKSAIDNSDSNIFFINKNLNQENKWYFVRGIIYNKNFTTNSENLNIGFGKNLKFKENTNKIYPEIYVTSSAFGNVCVKDFKVRPLTRGNSVNLYVDSNGLKRGSNSFGFSNVKNFTNIICKNNNNSTTEEKIEKQTRHKLIPYNTVLKMTFLEKN